MRNPDTTPTSLSAKWDRSRQLIKLGNRDGAAFADWDQAACLEIDVLRGPIRSVDDAVAKLRAIELAFVEGERTDGADAMALRQTIRWLQTHTCAALANDA
jgi:hypothetical protein